jgi:hypothetical protein
MQSTSTAPSSSTELQGRSVRKTRGGASAPPLCLLDCTVQQFEERSVEAMEIVFLQMNRNDVLDTSNEVKG